jgi:hypothetical protein
MKSTIITWFSNNWFAVLALIISVWLAIALRARPRIRFWVIGEGLAGNYILGSTRTIMYIRNIGNQPIDADQWRVPLSIECEANIESIEVIGVSCHDLTASLEFIEDERKQAILRLPRFDPGDEIELEIRHGNTHRAPQLKGELQGARDALVRGLTMKQRSLGAFWVIAACLMDYVELSSIVWLSHSKLTPGGITRGTIFLLASTFLPMLTGLLLWKAWPHHRIRAVVIVFALFLTLLIARITAFCTALVGGFRLWFPAFAIYVIVTMIVIRIAGVQLVSNTMGLKGIDSEDRRAFSVAGYFTATLGPTIFAFAVISNSPTNVLVLIGLTCVFAVAISRLDRQQLRERMSGALGAPRGRSGLYPPSKTNSSHIQSTRSSTGKSSSRKQEDTSSQTAKEPDA